jgi:hypothetical protein
MIIEGIQGAILTTAGRPYFLERGIEGLAQPMWVSCDWTGQVLQHGSRGREGQLA